MTIEEQEKLEIEAIEALERLAIASGIEYGEFSFRIHEGRIDDWKLGRHRKRKDLTKE